METKIEKFRTMINSKDIRKALVGAGFKYSIVYSWGQTERIPSEINAKKIAAILGMPLAEIPYYRRERVI